MKIITVTFEIDETDTVTLNDREVAAQTPQGHNTIGFGHAQTLAELITRALVRFPGVTMHEVKISGGDDYWMYRMKKQ